nr:ice-binding family protein [uncultured Glaciecola sp.]
MHHFTIKKSGFIRYSTAVIFWVSVSMSSIASADCLETDGRNSPATAEYISIAYSGAAITLGAHSTVFGDIQSVAAVTLGKAAEVDGSILAGAAVTIEKDGKVTGDVTAGEAATLGKSARVSGELAARAEVFIGAQSEISGDLTSSRGIKLGAGAKVFGNTTAAHSVTLGAYSEAGNDGLASDVRAMTGPIILGAHAKVKGDAKAGSIISMGMNAKVIGIETQHAAPDDFANKAENRVATKTEELIHKQKQLSETFVHTYNELNTTIDTSRDFYPGVYHASALTTTAGITLTFIGSGYGEPDEWLINIDTYLSFGANVTLDLVDVAEGSTIIFNAGTYTTIGANSTFRGTIFSGTYITTGANTRITGVGSDCGGMFATNGAITIGARSTFGALGCGQAVKQSEDGEESLEVASNEYYSDEYNDDEYYSDEYYSDEYNDDEYDNYGYYNDGYYNYGYYDDGYYDDEYYDDEYYDDEYYDDEYYDDEYYDDD